ncbi:lipid II:glycine glycyltransferase FemX [Chloroflexota bacterium]
MQQNLNGWEIWQNKGFGEIWAESLALEVLLVNDIQVFATKRPVLGYMIGHIYTPHLEYAKFLEINNFCNERGLIELSLRSYKRIDGLDAYLEDDTHGTYLLDLEQDEEELWHNLGDKNRNMVRKGTRNGVDVKVAKDKAELDKWYEIYKNASSSIGFQDQPYQLIKNLFNSEYSKLFCAYKDDIILSGAFIIHDNKCMVYWLGGFDREYAKYSPNNLLHWEIMMFGKKNNYLVYDLGGVPKSFEGGPSAFKKSFGGTFVALYTYKINFKNFKSKLRRTKLAEIGIRMYRKLS